MVREKKIVCILALGAAVFASGEANARVSTYQAPGSDTCFVSEYVPNLIEENTRGRLFRAPQAFVSNGVGNRRSGGIVRTGVEPAQYMKTQRVIEREHYTLTPGACPP